MVKDKYKIVWSKESKQSVKDIYDFYKTKSLQGAKNIKNDIQKSPKSIIFSKQFQTDELNPKYRRIVVRDYKVLYREVADVIIIVDVICSLMDSKKQLD